MSGAAASKSDLPPAKRARVASEEEEEGEPSPSSSESESSEAEFEKAALKALGDLEADRAEEMAEDEALFNPRAGVWTNTKPEEKPEDKPEEMAEKPEEKPEEPEEMAEDALEKEAEEALEKEAEEALEKELEDEREEEAGEARQKEHEKAEEAKKVGKKKFDDKPALLLTEYVNSQAIRWAQSLLPMRILRLGSASYAESLEVLLQQSPDKSELRSFEVEYYEMGESSSLGLKGRRFATKTGSIGAFALPKLLRYAARMEIEGLVDLDLQASHVHALWELADDLQESSPRLGAPP